jgi:uncharacterized membrane protein
VAEETVVERIAVIRRIHLLLWRMPQLAVEAIVWMFQMLFSGLGDGNEMPVVGELCQIEGRRRCIASDEAQPVGISSQT